jgi:hypothetical protein
LFLPWRETSSHVVYFLEVDVRQFPAFEVSLNWL